MKVTISGVEFTYAERDPSKLIGIEGTLPKVLTIPPCKKMGANVCFSRCRYVWASKVYEVDNVEEIIFPEGCVQIGRDCFANFKNLKKIHLPNSLKEIGADAFINCNQLEHIEADWDNIKLRKLGAGCFRNCERLTYFKIPKSLKTIDRLAFSCSGLENLEGDPYVIKKIDYGVFNGTPFREKIRTFRTADTLVFTNAVLEVTSDVARVLCDTFVLNFRAGSSIQHIDLPNVTEIPAGCFADFTELSEIKLPQVQIIGSQSFENCSSLQEIELPECQEVSYAAFANCYGLKRAVIPMINKMEAQVFRGCTNLAEIETAKLHSIGYNAFSHCYSLCSVDLADDCEIMSDAFVECINLNIDMPSAVSKIGTRAFLGCTSLPRHIYVPKSIRLGKHSFAECGDIEVVRV